MRRPDRGLGLSGGRNPSRESRVDLSRYSRRISRMAVIVFPLIAASAACGQAEFLPPDFGNPILVLNGAGHTAPPRALAFSPDGKYLFSGGQDRVVHAWRYRDREPRPEWTIRPPIRRVSGPVFALAVSPAADKRLVAVAGHSVFDGAGQILVYRLPAPNFPGTVELAFALPDRIETPVHDARNHAGMVFGLSFSTDGKYLASCSEDKTIRIWDVDDPKHALNRTLLADPTGVNGHEGAVLCVAFLGGDRLVSAGGIRDGSLRLWDWKQARMLKSIRPSQSERAANEGKGFAINCMASTPNGPHVVIGRENGRLERYDAADLKQGAFLNPDELAQNLAVEALAFAPDGRTLAAITAAHQAPRNELPLTECNVTVRTLPDGGDVKIVRTTGDVARALAFSPDGAFLAIGGGIAQEVAVVRMAAAGATQVFEAKGPGTVLWDVGFVDVASKPTVAFSRSRTNRAGQPVWQAYDFPAYRPTAVNPEAKVDRHIRTYLGWTVATPELNRLTVSRPQGDPITLKLDDQGGRWTSYTFIPPNRQAGHDTLALAVGCSNGPVLIYTLPDGIRTRALHGHGGGVYDLAPSPDGRWLATASTDQTIRLWSLEGCDTRPELGATLDPPDGQGFRLVKKVDVRSPAHEMGLKDGDRVAKVSEVGAGLVGMLRSDGAGKPIEGRPMILARLDAEIAELAPGSATAVMLDVRRGANAVGQLATFRLTRSALNLLPGSDGEWIVWMPEGFYETSIAGDNRLLGWHLNKTTRQPIAQAVRFHPAVSDFFPMSWYERLFHHRAVIDRLLQTGDAVQALAVRPAIARVQRPPSIKISNQQGVDIGTELAVQQPEPSLTLQIVPEADLADRRVVSIVVRNGQVPNPPREPAPPAQPAQAIAETVRLWPGPNPISIEAVDDLGVKGMRNLVVQFQPTDALKPQPSSRLLIRSVGVESFETADFPGIDFASRDVNELAAALPKLGLLERLNQIDRSVLDHNGKNNRSTAHEMRAMFERLTEEADRERLAAGDTVFLVIESHILSFAKEGARVLAIDARRDKPGQTCIGVEEIARCLKYLSIRGCLVVLFLDGIHSDLSPDDLYNFRQWVRELRDECGVVVCVASKQYKSDRLEGEGIGVFAKAILQSRDVQAAARGDSPTIEEFKYLLINRVDELKRTTSKQKADLYSPANLDERLIRIFDPQQRPSTTLAGK